MNQPIFKVGNIAVTPLIAVVAAVAVWYFLLRKK